MCLGDDGVLGFGLGVGFRGVGLGVESLDFITTGTVQSFGFPWKIPQGLSHRMSSLIIFGKSTSPHDCQVIVYFYQLEYGVDDFIGELSC